MNSGEASDNDRISFCFEGRKISCQAGLSIAAALIAAGELELRATNHDDERGLFCGMGVCQECRVTINGRSGVRACMEPAAAGLQVFRDETLLIANTDDSEVVNDASFDVVTPEILVIGAGPGGLTAASVAAESGAEVIVLDERHSGGGQYYKQPASAATIPDSLVRDRQFADGYTLIDRSMQSGASVLFDMQVWGAFAPNEFAVFDGECNKIYKPERTIVATGAYERGLPLPGWTMPGVMTTGAAQSLLRSYGILPGERILVAGNGPFNIQVALELKRGGAKVVAVSELAQRYNAKWLTNGIKMGLHAPGLALNGMRYLAGLWKNGVPVLYGQGLARVEKIPSGLRAWLGKVKTDGIDAENAYEVDIVCMGYGFLPSNEILRSVGCSHSYDDYRGHLVTSRNTDCETSVPGVYAIGDCTGLKGAPSALQEGVIAATAAIRSLGRNVSPRHEKQRKRAVQNLERHRKFQAALWEIFAAPRFQTELANPDTVVCRCENVCLAEIENSIETNARSVGAIKRLTRLGMGPCQGRYCAPVVAALLAKQSGDSLDEFSFFAPRSPLKPLRIADVLSTGNQ